MKLEIHIDDPQLTHEQKGLAAQAIVEKLPKSSLTTDLLRKMGDKDDTGKSIDTLITGGVEIIVKAGQVATALTAVHSFLKVAFPNGLKGTASVELDDRKIDLPSNDLAASIEKLQEQIMD